MKRVIKTVSSLLAAVFLAGGMYAQSNDTIPASGNQPNAGSKDTLPSLKKDTMPSLRRDTVNWSKDSLKNKKWNDSLGNQHHSMNDSMSSAGNNPDWKDTTGVNADAGKWKDSSQSSTDKNKWNDSSSVSIGDKSKMEDKKHDKMKEDKEDKMNQNEGDSTSTTTTKTKKIMKDRVMMKDGEMLIIKKGEEMKLVKSITLADGSVVTTDGTVKMPGGNSVKLKDGEYINIGPQKVTKSTKTTKTTKKSKE